MLKTILSVSGRPGLFRLLSSAKNMVIVESLADQRRLPIYARDKVVSLSDIAMYTEEGEVALAEILGIVYKKHDGKEMTPISKPEELRTFFSEILPTYDKERVYDSDIKKLITWYNLLIRYGIQFEEVKNNEEVKVEVDTEIIESPDKEVAETDTPKKKSTRKPKATKDKTETKEKTETKVKSGTRKKAADKE